MVLRWREVLAAGHACPKILVCYLFIYLFFLLIIHFLMTPGPKTGLTGGDYVFHMAIDSGWSGMEVLLEC